MRSLSKTWNSLLSHSSFIKSHLAHSKGTNNKILLVFQDWFISKDIPVPAYISPNLQLANSVKARIRMDSLQGYVVGAVNGLVCLQGEGCCTIWNPSLSASIDLPPYTIGMLRDRHRDSDSDSDSDSDYIYSHYDYRDSVSDYNFVYGDLNENERFYYKRKSIFKFGFDPKKNDYKVVKLTYGYSNYDYRILHWLPVEVFSVVMGSWESITEKFPSYVRDIYDYEELVVDGHNGRLHYLCRVNNGDERMQKTIVAFDLGDETFSEIALPDSIQDHRWRMVLGVLSKKLCVISGLRNGGCEVWVMENYGVATSWVKRHYVIPKYKGDDVVPVGFTLNNHFVFAHGDHLSLYDPEASTSRDFKGVKSFSSLRVVQYVDSLVWVTHTKWANNDVCISSSQIEKKQHLLDG